MSKEEQLMKRILNTALKFSPLMYVLIGATGTYYSLKGEIDGAKREIERHIAEYSHGNWVSGDRLLHPALRGSIVKLIEQQLTESNKRLQSNHQLWNSELECQHKWDRLFDRNPQLNK